MTSDTPALEGYLESPGPWHPASGALIVGGWVFSRGTPVRGVEIVVDGGPPVPLAYGVVRPDVERLYATAGSLPSGFGARIRLAATNLKAVRVELHVVFDDDRRVRWIERDIRLYEAGQVARARRVAGTLIAAVGAAVRERRLPPAPATWFATLRRHWEGAPSLQPFRHTTPRPFDRERFEASYRRFRRHHQANGRVVLPRRTVPAALVLIADSPALVQLDRIVTNAQAAVDEIWVVAVEGSIPAERIDEVARRHGVQIRVTQVSQLGGADGRWLLPGEAPHVVLLDGRAIPAVGGIDRVLTALEESPADWVFSDDDRFDPGSEPCDPYLKGAFSPESALLDDYATRLAAVRRAAVTAVGGLQASAREAQIAELLFRVWSHGSRIQHVAAVCCHRLSEVPAIPSAAHRAVSAAWLSAASNLPVSLVEESIDGLGRVARVRWSAAAAERPVTIVIPTRDRVALLRVCVDSLVRTVDAARTELLIVDDGSTEEETREYLLQLSRSESLRSRVIPAPAGDGDFNYARLMNAGAAAVSTPLMLHLNNDIEAIVPGWLEQMAGWFSCPGIGVVGAKLIYRDRSLQHTGVFMSPWQATPHHSFRRLKGSEPGYQWMPHRLRNVSGVTGACLLTDTRLYRESGGFNAAQLAVQFNDIDYCLRLIGRGLRVVYEPAAVLFHDESASRGRAFDYRENAYFQDTHRAYRDPFLSPHLDAESLCGPTPVLMSPTRDR